MSLSPYTVVIFSQDTGNVVPFAQVSIKERNSDGSSGQLAAIYTNETGSTPITQPGATTNNRGTLLFYASADGYNVEYAVDGQVVVQPIDVGIPADSLTNRGLPSNDFNKAVSFGSYIGFGDGAGEFSSNHAPEGSGNVRLIVNVSIQDKSIVQYAVAANTIKPIWYYRVAYAGDNDFESALEDSPWSGLASLNTPNVFEDTVGTIQSLIDIEHNADGSGSPNGQTYALDIHNNPSAKSAFVIHQYSNNGPAMWLDNTDDSAMIRINNTKNTTRNPSHPEKSNGSFFELQDENFTQWELTADYVWKVHKTPKWLALGTASAAEFISPSKKSEPTVKIDRDYNVDGVGSALAITTDGGSGVDVAQNGPGFAFSASCGAGQAGFWSMSISGYDYGAKFSTDAGSGAALRVEKKGTSTGDAIEIIDGETETLAIEKEGIIRVSNASNMQTTVGASGVANATPASPEKYLKVKDEAGLVYLIPMYKA